MDARRLTPSFSQRKIVNKIRIYKTFVAPGPKKRPCKVVNANNVAVIREKKSAETFFFGLLSYNYNKLE